MTSIISILDDHWSSVYFPQADGSNGWSNASPVPFDTLRRAVAFIISRSSHRDRMWCVMDETGAVLWGPHAHKDAWKVQ